MTQPTASAITALPAANDSVARVEPTKCRPPSTLAKFSSPHRVASPGAPATVTLPCSRNMSGGRTSAASAAINSVAIQVVWRAPPRLWAPAGFGRGWARSAEELIENPFPPRLLLLDGLRREEMHAEMAF